MRRMSESEYADDSGGGALGAALAMQWRLARAVSEGIGLAGLASVLADAVGRAAVIWAACSVAPAVSSPDVRAPNRPTPSTARRWSDETAFLHEEWLWRVAQPAGPESLVIVGFAEADETASEEQRLAMEETAAIAALEVYRIQSVTAAELRVWGELADEIIDDDNRLRVLAHAEALGFDHSTMRRVALVTAHEIEPDALLKTVSSAARRVGADALVTVRNQRVVMIVADDFDFALLLQVVRETNAGESIAIGVSACCDVVREYQVAAHQAEVAAALSAAMHRNGITHYDDLGVYRLLAANGDTRELNQYVERWLGPVIEYDRKHRSELVRSLAAYLERGGALDQAAESLFIHRSTLKYRLRRIAGLANVDLTNPDTRFNLQLATRVLATIAAVAASAPY